MEPIDWASEWMTSLLWIGEVFAYTVAGFWFVSWLLIRRTVWGRQFWRLARDHIIPERRDWISWRPLLTVGLLLLLAVTSVRIAVVISNIQNGFFTALGERDAESFYLFLGIFLILSVVFILRALFDFYVQNAFVIRWRLQLNDWMVGDWLDGQAYHRGRFVGDPVDNPDQRIQEDISSFTSTSLSLGLGAVSSAVSLVSFSIILWGLSGPLTVLGTEIPRAMVFIAYLYVIVASVIAFRVGRPLIRLNFLQERFGGSFRYALVRLRENSENVAFYRGEPAERVGLDARFAAVIDNAWAIVFRSLKFLGFNATITQFSQIFPLVLQAPRYFSGGLTLGDVQQTAVAFAQVEAALSFFRNAYDNFAGYRAVLDRLTGLLDSNEEARALPGPDTEDRDAGIGIRGMTVRLPDGCPLLSDLDIELAAGESLLVKGPSGTGKTTLLRSLAGLWPHVGGIIARPSDGRALFLSQQPYLPLGSLRTALAYPDAAEELGDDTARQMLRDVQLGHLADRLDEVADWSKTLSPGEQQRLGFGRILLTKPSLAFLDEATSALDEGMEHAMYDLVRERLPACTIVSVGHRSTLEALHTNQLELLGEGRWESSALVR